jgi:hypothetical protein
LAVWRSADRCRTPRAATASPTPSTISSVGRDLGVGRSVGDAYDNVVAESVIGLYKYEASRRTAWRLV